jgi:hypothetical protein
VGEREVRARGAEEVERGQWAVRAGKGAEEGEEGWLELSGRVEGRARAREEGGGEWEKPGGGEAGGEVCDGARRRGDGARCGRGSGSGVMGRPRRSPSGGYSARVKSLDPQPRTLDS